MNEIEDVSFLPAGGSGSTGKKGVYEPDNLQRCQQVVCSPRKSIFIVSCFVLVIFIIALIAAFARTGSSKVGCIAPTEPPISDAKPTVATATNGEVFPWADIRLPDGVIPKTYYLFLHPNLTTFRFSGNVSILLETKKKTNFLIYHSKELKITSQELLIVSSDGQTALQRLKILKSLEYVNHEQVYLLFESNLEPGQAYHLNINFIGNLSDNLAGFYRSSYETSSGEKRWLATTHFEATDARAAFPCFDEPHLKANFTLAMVREPRYISLFNTEELSSEDFGDGLKLDRFATSVTMSTYLVAFVVCDFGSKSAYTEKSRIKVSIYAPEELLNQTDFALEVAKNVLEFYEEYYGIKYPMNKSDHIAIPDFSAGAMENWGLVTYLMRSLLYNAEESSAGDQQWVAVVVAHELAHQWFGNLVTMKWWNDLWLNEGFARFVEYHGADHARPEWNMLGLFVDDALSVALYNDGLMSSHPISVEVHDPVEIGEIFDAISYEKGASVIRMLESVLGEDIFLGGLRSYLTKHMYGNAETDDLWAAMTQEVKTQSSLNVKEMMDTWTLQMGYPVITVRREGRQITASQERFLYNPRTNLSDEFPSPFGYKWFVPLTYITKTNPANVQPIQWMKKGDVSFTLDDNPLWIKMNANMTGVYRVHYDLTNWQALIHQLATDHEVFGPSDRASLIADAFALSRSGHLNVTVALDLSRYLALETDYVPWQIALSCLGYIGDILETRPEFSYFTTYLQHLLKNLLKGQQSDLQRDDTSHIDKLLTATVLSESVRRGFRDDVVDEMKKLFNNWMKNNTNIDPNLKSVVYVTGVKYGGDEEWDYVWHWFQQTQTPSEKSKLLQALSATNDGLKLSRFLLMSLDESKVRSAETPSVIQSIANNPAGRVLAWRFVRANWNALYSRYHNVMMKMKRIILAAAGHFSTQFDYDEVKEFFTKHLQGENLRSVSQALDRIEMNIDWTTRNEAVVIEWLKRETDQMARE